MGHNNEVHYSRIHLCAGGLTCPIYSWDPNWTTCTNQASESSTKKGISFALYIFFPYNLLRLPILQAPWLLAWTHLTPSLPLFSNLKTVGIIFSYCLCWISLFFFPPLSVKDSLLSGFDLYVFSCESFCPSGRAGAEITYHC